VRPRPALLLGLAALAAAVASVRPPAGLAAPPPAGPADADERLRKVQERRKALEQDLARLRGQEKSLLGEVERLEVEVRLRAEELREIQIGLQRTQEQMDATVKRVNELEAQVERERPVLMARARALYKLGELSYLRLLLSVEKPSDIFRGYRFVTALARRDNQRIAAFRADLKTLAATRADLEARTREAITLREGREKARRALDADRRRKTALLTQIVEQKETHAAYLAELQEAEARLSGLLAGLAEGDASVPVAAFKGALPWPAAGPIRSTFGRHKHPKFDTYTIQNGIEIQARADTPVAAVHEGSVVFAERFKGYGLMVVVDHGGKHHSLYAHLAEARVQPGQRVAAGDVIGTVGTALEGPGLYFEMRFQGRPQDPVEWLRPAP
jgi:septal ring factor EnvC (AmiA/AmiB activator)